MDGLYLDTCNHLVLGPLDAQEKQVTWSDYFELFETKSSGLIHKYIYEILERKSLDIQDISFILHTNGPGSYTGMRVSSGLCQVLGFLGIQIYSVYHFEIPQHCLKYQKGLWFSRAFKGEYFVYCFESDSSQKLLIKEADFKEYMREKQKREYNFFTHYRSWASKDEELFKEFNVQETGKLIYNNIDIVLQYAKRTMNQNRRPYYYRPLEKEFNCIQHK